MKKFFALLLFSFLFAPVKASDMLDVDYGFIDSAFEGIKPVTNQQFDETINRLTPQPIEDTFGAKLKAFFFGRQYGKAPQAKGQDEPIDIGGEMKAIQDVKNGVYYIKLVVSLMGVDGNVIPLGNYKIQEKSVNGIDFLMFYQGSKEYGRLKLGKFEDNLKGKHDLTYSRVDILNDEMVRIVYSTIKDTKCAYAKVVF